MTGRMVRGDAMLLSGCLPRVRILVVHAGWSWNMTVGPGLRGLSSSIERTFFLLSCREEKVKKGSEPRSPMRAFSNTKLVFPLAFFILESSFIKSFIRILGGTMPDSLRSLLGLSFLLLVFFFFLLLTWAHMRTRVTQWVMPLNSRALRSPP